MKQSGQKPVPKKHLNNDALLNLVKTSNLISCLADSFFPRYQTTDAEFNILMTLNNFSAAGLSQKELSEELVIKKSNLVGIIDKLEEKRFVKRNKDSSDRRLNKIVLTSKGKDFIESIQENYFDEVDRLMNNLEIQEKETLIELMQKLNSHLNLRLKEK